MMACRRFFYVFFFFFFGGGCGGVGEGGGIGVEFESNNTNFHYGEHILNIVYEMMAIVFRPQIVLL